MNELLNLVKCCEYGNLTAINDLKFPWQEMECGLEAEQKKMVKNIAGWVEKNTGDFAEWTKEERDAN